MIILDCEQGSPEWHAARAGIPTASRFHKIITQKTMKLSEQASPFAYQMAVEQIYEAPLDDGESYGFMERGQVNEERARRFYSMQKDVDIQKIGFVLRDDERVGCSPDGFVGTEGIVEIKSPIPWIHARYSLGDAGIGHRAQVQGQLWICEREWVDTISYHPEQPSAILRVYRDDMFIRALAAAIESFLADVAEKKRLLLDLGWKKPDYQTAA